MTFYKVMIISISKINKDKEKNYKSIPVVSKDINYKEC